MTDEASQYGTTASSWTTAECKFLPLAEIRVHARVLATERYWLGRTAKLSPVDLAIGWGEMSAQKILDELIITQGGRWYSLRARNGSFPVALELLQAKSANMHMIPATDTIREQLLNIRKGDIIRFDGTLVEVSWPDGARWRSSLRRTDTGDGSCELVWLKELNVEP